MVLGNDQDSKLILSPDCAPTKDKCVVKHCTDAAQWRPKLVVYSMFGNAKRGGTLKPFITTLSMGLCAYHKEQMKKEHVVGKEGLSMLQNQFLQMGRAMPNYESIDLLWEKGEAKPNETPACSTDHGCEVSGDSKPS